MGCGQQETNMHYLHYTKMTATKLCHKSLQQLQAHLKEMNTAPQITKTIIDNIHHWCDNTTPPQDYSFIGVLQQFSTHLTAALDNQQDLGWDKFIQGFISTSWG